MRGCFYFLASPPPVLLQMVGGGEVRFICSLCALETSGHVISVMKSENTSAQVGETFWLIVLF